MGGRNGDGVRALRIAVTLAMAGALIGCAAPRDPWDLGAGRGRVAAIVEWHDADAQVHSELRLFGPGENRPLDVAAPRTARWLDERHLLVGVRSPPAEGDYVPRVQIRVVDLDSGESRAIGRNGLYFDLEPSPDGALLALGVQQAGLGDSDLQIWDLRAPREPLAERAQTLDRPRWSPDGRHLAVSLSMPDSDDAEVHDGVSIEGVALSWPRLFRLRRDLVGKLEPLHDGVPGGAPAPGGTLPLWWDARGIWARQRAGLVRCDPEGGGCTLVYAPAGRRSVLGGCTFRGGEAWLLVMNEATAGGDHLANEMHRVDLASGTLLDRWRAPAGRFVADLDCGD
ncbi:MAG: hypothetical protein JRG76_00745 [Deltaproteobacteria bacterium]|nr:hypothetical protein [Deltaproteobacteria bacterium]MBW2413009.1 hypothetical protein [Deltaproteobacteria bacterium]